MSKRGNNVMHSFTYTLSSTVQFNKLVKYASVDISPKYYHKRNQSTTKLYSLTLWSTIRLWLLIGHVRRVSWIDGQKYIKQLFESSCNCWRQIHIAVDVHDNRKCHVTIERWNHFELFVFLYSNDHEKFFFFAPAQDTTIHISQKMLANNPKMFQTCSNHSTPPINRFRKIWCINCLWSTFISS